MTPWNDSNAWIKGNGNLTLGQSQDDAAFDATYTYAKKDVELPVIAPLLIGDTLPALTYDGTRTTVPMRTLAASTTHKVIVPFPQMLLRTNTTAPHGALVNTVSLFYRVNTTTLTSATMALEVETLAAATSLGAAVAPAGAVTGNTLTAAANVYEMIFTPTTPAWITTTGSIPYVLATIVTPGSSTCDLFGATWRCSYSIY